MSSFVRYSQVRRWVIVVFAFWMLLTLSGCLAVSAARTGVGMGVRAGRAAGTVVGKGVGAAVDAAVPDRKEAAKPEK